MGMRHAEFLILSKDYHPLVIVFPIYPLSAASIIAFLSVRSLLSA